MQTITHFFLEVQFGFLFRISIKEHIHGTIPVIKIRRICMFINVPEKEANGQIKLALGIIVAYLLIQWRQKDQLVHF